MLTFGSHLIKCTWNQGIFSYLRPQAELKVIRWQANGTLGVCVCIVFCLFLLSSLYVEPSISPEKNSWSHFNFLAQTHYIPSLPVLFSWNPHAEGKGGKKISIFPTFFSDSVGIRFSPFLWLDVLILPCWFSSSSKSMKIMESFS